MSIESSNHRPNPDYSTELMLGIITNASNLSNPKTVACMSLTHCKDFFSNLNKSIENQDKKTKIEFTVMRLEDLTDPNSTFEIKQTYTKSSTASSSEIEEKIAQRIMYCMERNKGKIGTLSNLTSCLNEQPSSFKNPLIYSVESKKFTDQTL